MGGLCSMFEKDYLKNIQKNGWGGLHFVPEDKITPEMCLLAVRMNGWALELVPEHMKTYEICFVAVCNRGGTLRYVPENKITPQLCLEAVRTSGYALLFVPWRMMTPELCLAAVQYHGSALMFVPEYLLTDEIIETAFQTFPGAVHFIRKKLVIDTGESKQMPPNAYDTLQMGYDEETAIRHGELMVDFHNEFKYGRFYRKKTFEDLVLPSKTNGYTKELITEYTIYRAIV